MPIVSSSYTLDAHLQADGSRYCKESHTDNLGRVHVIGPYKLPAGQGDTQAQARTTANASVLSASLAEAEFEGVVSGS